MHVAFALQTLEGRGALALTSQVRRQVETPFLRPRAVVSMIKVRAVAREILSSWMDGKPKVLEL